MTDEEFREKFRGSAIRRTKRSGLRRNAVIAMGNSGDQRFAPLLEKLKADEDAGSRGERSVGGETPFRGCTNHVGADALIRPAKRSFAIFVAGKDVSSVARLGG